MFFQEERDSDQQLWLILEKFMDIDYKKLIIIGAAIECLHSYSLMHDDLPSMDNDELRRGKLSVHKKFNEFTAMLQETHCLL